MGKKYDESHYVCVHKMMKQINSFFCTKILQLIIKTYLELLVFKFTKKENRILKLWKYLIFYACSLTRELNNGKFEEEIRTTKQKSLENNHESFHLYHSLCAG